MTLHGAICTLRPWRLDDVCALTEVANDRDVARFLTHRFPSPYTRADAEAWIRLKLGETPVLHWAIEYDGTVAGGIGVTPGTGEHSGTAMIGYWLGRRFWRRGIATDALRAATAHTLATLRPHRLWANVFAGNAPSARVLEKAGFVREAVLARSLVDRDGIVHDELILTFGAN